MDKFDLRFDLVDTSDHAAFTGWLEAQSRGFYRGRLTDAQLSDEIQLRANRQNQGVWDSSAADPKTPVATADSWPLMMTVPDGLRVSAWAISSVTVAPTHRRRGIARTLLERELRTAIERRFPFAVLAASEATLYGRYGFGPATQRADLTIQNQRIEWVGRTPSGRTHLVSLEDIHNVARHVLERAQIFSPGEVTLDDYLWGRLVGIVADFEGKAKHRRAVRYDDANGVPQGFAIYSVKDSGKAIAPYVATVHYLCSVTDDAHAGLWQYLLGLDLVGSVYAPLRPVEEPLLWLIDNPRAVRVGDVGDHLWLRILNLKEALEARRYNSVGQIVLHVSDPLGYATGSVLLTIDETGAGVATMLQSDSPEVQDTPQATAEISLGVSELSSLYLGGVSAVTLAKADRLTEVRSDSARRFDTVFHSPQTPWLSTWF